MIKAWLEWGIKIKWLTLNKGLKFLHCKNSVCQYSSKKVFILYFFFLISNRSILLKRTLCVHIILFISYLGSYMIYVASSLKLGERGSVHCVQGCSDMLLSSSLGYCRSVVEIYVDKGFTLGTPWVVKRMLSSS